MNINDYRDPSTAPRSQGAGMGRTRDRRCRGAAADRVAHRVDGVLGGRADRFRRTCADCRARGTARRP